MVQDQHWTDYWKQDGKSGEVFVNHEGQKPQFLSKEWTKFFSSISEGDSLLDIACGAGSIFQQLLNKQKYKLIGTDISAEALKQFTNTFADAESICCSSEAIPLPDNSVDVVVSQFGVEYAGENGFKEALRVLKPKGKFNFILHYQNGYIDADNRIQLQGVQLVRDKEFIRKAKAVVHSLDDEVAFSSAFDEFSQVEPILFNYSQEHPKGVHHHLYYGFRKLLTARDKYNKSDILTWLEQMEEEVEMVYIRLSSMCSAAFSKERLDKMIADLFAKQVSSVSIDEVVKAGELPVAWLLSGEK